VHETYKEKLEAVNAIAREVTDRRRRLPKQRGKPRRPAQHNALAGNGEHDLSAIALVPEDLRVYIFK